MLCLARFSEYEQAGGRLCFIFLQNLNNIKCWRQATSPIEQPAGVTEPQKLYCLLERRRRRRRGVRENTSRDENRQRLCLCAYGWSPSLILTPISGHNRSVWSPKARGDVHFTQKVVGCGAEVRGHHLDSFSYLGTSPLALIEVMQCGLQTCDP